MRRLAGDCCDVPCFQQETVDRLRERAPTASSVAAVAGLFSLLADPTRVKLLSAFASGEELCVCDVANVVGLSLSATSHQLRKLRDAGMLTFRSDGRMAYYRLLDGFAAGLLAQARLHTERLDALEAKDAQP